MTIAAARPLALPVRGRIDVHTYHRMGHTGDIAPNARVELIDGEIIEMPPIGPDHAQTVDGLAYTPALLQIVLKKQLLVRVQGPVRLSEEDEPQPDIAILRWRQGGYRNRHPGPADVLLLIEVADSTLLLDRTRKIPLYARSGIQEIWLVNLVDRRFEIHREPQGGAYPEPRILASGKLSPLLLPGLEIDIADILG